jgi:hypothetical protein
VPSGGHEPARWYEVTQWSAYQVLAADGETKGRDAYVWEAGLLHSLAGVRLVTWCGPDRLSCWGVF